MKNLKLEVGKTYRNRRGEEVTIVWKGDNGEFSYLGDDKYYYSENGNFLPNSKEHSNDLIGEVTVPDANKKRNGIGMLKLEVGKTYRNRKGREITIVKYSNDREYAFRYTGSDGKWYAEDGRFDKFYNEPLYDLIEEVEDGRK
jgi:hypothetical protein